MATRYACRRTQRRLAFRPVGYPGELIELMTLVLDGTLDAHSRDDLTRMTPQSGRAGAVPRIRAATDVGNAPMAAAFARAGYLTFERQIDMTWR